MSQVKKAVIPVAGLGTRMLPATKAIPKEMLPVVDKPLIQYVVSECVAAGLKEIILVTHASKNSIENHFDTSFELEATLEKRVKRQLLEEVQSICPKDVTIMHIRQGVANGLGHAVLCARPLIGDAPGPKTGTPRNRFATPPPPKNLKPALISPHSCEPGRQLAHAS